ncbi:hypothetical protein RB653_002859 [Dictyostelium firmibasis]|uniref:Uncharacterized protein n=1 Tax=Dictyostelium firmibasis TaxID=79012 RepID=A0AAN7YT34_9MYCE
MKILILLVLLISVCYSQQLSKPLIVGDIYRGGQSCNSLQPPYVCSSNNMSGGMMMREGTCTYLRGLSSVPTTYNSSSDGSQVIQYSYAASDYFCQDAPIQTQNIASGNCQAGCSTSGMSYLYNLSPVWSQQFPSNTILTIKSQSSTCETDWQTSWESIEYINLNTCIVDEVNGGSFKLGCNKDSIAVYSYGGAGCVSNPKTTYVELYTSTCDGYQVCNN